MVIDDHSGMRQMIRALLGRLGVETVECDDGSQVVEMYRCTRPNWVFMDSELKNRGGLSATRELLASFADARVLFLGDENLPQLRKAAVNVGARAFMTKDELLDGLRKQRAGSFEQLETLWAVTP